MPEKFRNAMNLDIQLAWCQHWIREHLGLSPSASIVLFISDARHCDTWQRRLNFAAIQSTVTEVRWQFASPTCILLKIIDPRQAQQAFEGPSLSGWIDQHACVDNATDLVGWLGAARSIFVLENTHSDSNHSNDYQLTTPTHQNLTETLATICSGFNKPWNLISNSVSSNLRLDWESLHQPQTVDQHKSHNRTTMDFKEAVATIQRSIDRTSPFGTQSTTKQTQKYKQAG